MAGHVIVSYVRENAPIVDRLAADLEACGVKLWLDRNDITPGQRWRDAIREAIREGDLFMACFSGELALRERAYMHEELTLAIEELRRRPTDRTWFVPVTLDGYPIPSRPIGAGEMLDDLQWINLAADWHRGIEKVARLVFEKRLHSWRRRNTIGEDTGNGSIEVHTSPLPHESPVEKAERILRERNYRHKVSLQTGEYGAAKAMHEWRALRTWIELKASLIQLGLSDLGLDVDKHAYHVDLTSGSDLVRIEWVQPQAETLVDAFLAANVLVKESADGDFKHVSGTTYRFVDAADMQAWIDQAGRLFDGPSLADRFVDLLLTQIETREIAG